MMIQCHLRIEKDNREFQIKIRRTGLGKEEDIYKLLFHVLYDVPRLVTKLLDCKTVSKQLAESVKQYTWRHNRKVWTSTKCFGYWSGIDSFSVN